MAGDENEVHLDCAVCGDITEHTVVREADAGWTVQCTECEGVRTVAAPRREALLNVPVILSHGAQSESAQVAIGADSLVADNDEFEVEGSRIRVTAVECLDGTRPPAALGRVVRVLYAIRFDTVRLLYTLNMGEITRSLFEDVSPEQQVHIGDVRDVQGVTVVIKTLKSDQNRTLHRGYLLARNVHRAFVDMARPNTRAGARVKPRRRGAAPGQSKPRNQDARPRGLGSRRA